MSKAKRGLFSRFFCCSNFDSEDSQSSSSEREQSPIPNYNQEVSDVPTTPSNIKIRTKVPITKVKVVEELDNSIQKRKHPFSCPVCFRYFSSKEPYLIKDILKTACCKNYLCVFCANDCKASALSKETIFSCHFCSKPCVTLEDVRMDEEIKKYFDSPIKPAATIKKVSIPAESSFSKSKKTKKKNEKIDKNERDVVNDFTIELEINKPNPIELEVRNQAIVNGLSIWKKEKFLNTMFLPIDNEIEPCRPIIMRKARNRNNFPISRRISHVT